MTSPLDREFEAAGGNAAGTSNELHVKIALEKECVFNLMDQAWQGEDGVRMAHLYVGHELVKVHKFYAGTKGREDLRALSVQVPYDDFFVISVGAEDTLHQLAFAEADAERALIIDDLLSQAFVFDGDQEYLGNLKEVMRELGEGNLSHLLKYAFAEFLHEEGKRNLRQQISVTLGPKPALTLE